MFKKWIIGLSCLGLFMSFTPLTFAHEYKDVPRDSHYFYPIDYLRRNDVFKDTEYFHPDILISKAEFIKYLVILNSPDFQPVGSANLPFEDTRNNAWYASYFKEAIDLGILDERERNVEPDKKLSIIEALTLLFHSQSIPIPNVYQGNIPYTDVQRNKAAAPLIMRALSFDLIQPQRNDYVGIYKRVTRAEAARMIYKLDLVTLGTATSNGLPSQSITIYGPELDKLVSVWELIESTYINRDSINKEEISDNVIRALVEELDDPYSSYLDEEENQEFFDDIDGEIEGIGAVIGFNEEGQLTIVSPIKDSPAQQAGLKAGDIILEVDGEDVSDMDMIEAVSLIKGPKGTTVTLMIDRNGTHKSITVTRDVIEIPSLDYEIIENGDVMLITLHQFNLNAPRQFEEAIDVIQQKDLDGMVLDLRDNPGGLLDAAVGILGFLLEPQADVVRIDYGDFSQTLYNRGNGELSDFPMVVLINGGSASASEIVAGALQDYDLATIVGEKSFGKGTVQEVNYFRDNSSLKLTVAEWITPDRNLIQGNGIIPDITVSDNETTEKDEQLQRAISELRKRM